MTHRSTVKLAAAVVVPLACMLGGDWLVVTATEGADSLLPALLIVLPVMAYASAHWTEAVFPSANPAP